MITKGNAMRITESQLRRIMRKAILAEMKTTQYGGKTFAIWSHIKNLSHRLGKGQRDEPSITKAMDYIANIAGYVLEYAIEEHPDPEINETDAQAYAVEYILGFAKQNRKKSMKSYCFAFIEGLYKFCDEFGQDLGTPEEIYSKQIFRILLQDGMI